MWVKSCIRIALADRLTGHFLRCAFVLFTSRYLPKRAPAKDPTFIKMESIRIPISSFTWDVAAEWDAQDVQGFLKANKGRYCLDDTTIQRLKDADGNDLVRLKDELGLQGPQADRVRMLRRVLITCCEATKKKNGSILFSN